ncbi:transposase-like protein [Polynucleobacter sphagniphilus]|nr:transposase-like protein [Polynucleobacter sphagniphilus]
MPWNESTKMDEKLKFVSRYLDGEKITALCQEFGISRALAIKSLIAIKTVV